MAPRYLSVSGFGKLPFWPEYLETGVFLDTSRSLKQWLHHGREHVGMDDPDGNRDQHIRRHVRLLTGLPGSAELLAGVVRPSQDRGGRAFPFAVFVHLPRREYRKRYALLPIALGPVWEQLDEAWSSLASRASKEGFEEIQQSLQVEQPAAVSEAQTTYDRRRSQPVEALSDRNDGANLDTLKANMPGVLRQLRRQANGVSLLLPVARDLNDACVDASAWIDLINAQFLLRRFTPNVFLDATPGERDRTALLKFGLPDGRDYAAAMGFSSRGLPQPASPKAAADRRDVQEPGPPTYAELLGSRFGRS